jgi:hypothetical protein
MRWMCKKRPPNERYNVLVITLRYILRYRITLQHCGEKILLLIVIALGIWKWLSLLKVIALGSEGNVITFYSYLSESTTKAITCIAVTF